MVIALDPGPVESAYVIWRDGKLVEFGKVTNAGMLDILRRYENNLNQRCVIEMIEGRGMPVSNTVFETCVYIGRFMQAFGPERVTRILRREVKLHLCGQARAKDANVRQEVINRLGAPGTKKAPGLTYGVSKDIWQALALLLTWLDRQNGQGA